MKQANSTTEAEGQVGSNVKRDSTKFYFFILAITTLLATNAYFYFKYKTNNVSTYELSNEKALMQEELNQIEADLNKIQNINQDLNSSLTQSQDSVRIILEQLRVELKQNNLTREKLAKAQQEIHRLRQEVNNYKINVAELSNETDGLDLENEDLKKEILEKNIKLEKLEDANTYLTEQLKSAAVIKASKLNLIGLKEKNNGTWEAENKAKRVDKIQINFTIVDNPLIEKGKINIYARIIDPSGNLNTVGNQFFELEGSPMQYTTKTEIDFTNLGEEYTLDWKDKKFKKGIYTILLYTNHSDMGRASISFN